MGPGISLVSKKSELMSFQFKVCFLCVSVFLLRTNKRETSGNFLSMLALDDAVKGQKVAGKDCFEDSFSGDSTLASSIDNTDDADEDGLMPPPPPSSSSPTQRMLGNYTHT